MRVLSAIEYLLTEEKKSSTYKIALLTSIIDYIIENPEEIPRNAIHKIPIIYIAKQFYLYYYPLFIFKENGIKQGNSKNLSIYTKIKLFHEKYQINIPNNLSTDFKIFTKYYLQLRDAINADTVLPNEFSKMLRNVRKIILEMPMQHIKISDTTSEYVKINSRLKIKNTGYAIFGLISSEMNGDMSYNEIRVNATKWNLKSKTDTWFQIMDQETTFILIGHQTYSELAELRFVIKEMLIKQWIDISKTTYHVGREDLEHMFDALQLPFASSFERDTTTMNQLREIAKVAFPKMECIFCEKDIHDKFALDHLIPWSKLPIDRFWNLYPICQSCNSKKSNNIIEIDEELITRIHDYLLQWIIYFNGNKTELRRYGGKIAIVPNINNEQLTLFLLDRVLAIFATLS